MAAVAAVATAATAAAPITANGNTTAASSEAASTPATATKTSPPAAPTPEQPVPSDAPSHNDTPPADFAGDIDVNNNIPTAKELAAVADLVVLAADGSSRPFKSLFSGEGVPSRVLVIFVRHFFCGNCQEYLRTLSPALPPAELLSLPTPTFITIVGCGRPDLIPMYTEVTSCPFPIYADPSRKLYDLLGMSRTLNLGSKKPEYIRQSIIAGMGKSILQGLKMGRKAGGGGDVRQVGGEMLFENGKVVWCHRMKNTRDHAEVSELRHVLGLDRPVKEEEPAPVLVGGPTEPSTLPHVPVANGVEEKKVKESRRRSVDLRNVMKRMSGDWGRRSSGNVAKVKDFDANGAIAEGTRGHHNTEVTTSEQGTKSSTPAPPAATNGAAVEPVAVPSAGGEAAAKEKVVAENGNATAPAAPATAAAPAPESEAKPAEVAPKAVEAVEETPAKPVEPTPATTTEPAPAKEEAATAAVETSTK